jgi:hypothetical protein
MLQESAQGEKKEETGDRSELDRRDWARLMNMKCRAVHIWRIQQLPDTNRLPSYESIT